MRGHAGESTRPAVDSHLAEAGTSTRRPACSRRQRAIDFRNRQANSCRSQKDYDMQRFSPMSVKADYVSARTAFDEVSFEIDGAATARSFSDGSYDIAFQPRLSSSPHIRPLPGISIEAAYMMLPADCAYASARIAPLSRLKRADTPLPRHPRFCATPCPSAFIGWM